MAIWKRQVSHLTFGFNQIEDFSRNHNVASSNTISDQRGYYNVCFTMAQNVIDTTALIGDMLLNEESV